ncbi:MAG: Rossmann-like and DUF2520 domain-containing protein [Crocinitomicaceae bacterium]
MNHPIQKISIVGLGNVGSHLFDAFSREGIKVTHVYSRSKPSDHVLHDAEWVKDPSELPTGQLAIVCVPDDVISSILNKIPDDCPVAYTSGSVILSNLPKRESLGVFYPLQTFTKGSPINIFEVPFFIESYEPEFASQLFDLAWKISRNVNYASSEDRKKLHLAAVFINNFTNHLAHISKSYLDQEELDFDHLKPLLKETARKLESQDPINIQTGPARRKDQEIINEHITALQDPVQKEIYRLISKSIHQTYFND